MGSEGTVISGALFFWFSGRWPRDETGPSLKGCNTTERGWKNGKMEQGQEGSGSRAYTILEVRFEGCGGAESPEGCFPL
jgi:hypothetical protein